MPTIRRNLETAVAAFVLSAAIHLVELPAARRAVVRLVARYFV